MRRILGCARTAAEKIGFRFIIKSSAATMERIAEENLITLCADCHQFVHNTHS